MPGAVSAHLVGVLVGLRREHPDELAVAAERDRLDAVLGLALLPRPQGAAEADEELRDLDVEELAGDQVAQPRAARSRAASPTANSEHAEGVHQGSHRAAVLQRVPRSVARAQASAASTSSTVRSALRAYVVAVQHRGHRVDDVDEGQLAGAEGLDAHLVGGVVDRRGGAAARPRLTRQAYGGEGLVVEREELPGLRTRPVDRRRGVRRAGRARPGPRAIGISIVGGLACASVEPSVNSTIECTTLVGCTTTSMRSNGMSKSRCASITSSPLLTSVAELIVTTGPMSQVGWSSASSGVTSASSSRRPAAEGSAAGGEHEAAYLLRAAAAQALRQRAVLAVDRHDLAGLGQRGHHGPADDQRLLVGQRQRVAGVQRRDGRPQAHGAGDRR